VELEAAGGAAELEAAGGAAELEVAGLAPGTGVFTPGLTGGLVPAML